MKTPIICLRHWFQTPPGRYLLAWEQAQCDGAVVDIFGYHALQLGVPELQAFRNNRIAHRWLALDEATSAGAVQEDTFAAGTQPTQPPALFCEATALPFAADSFDLVILPHTLECSADPHAALREVARVLRPEGRILIFGFNPTSLWASRERRTQLWRKLHPQTAGFLPPMDELIGHWRLRDWLHLLNFETLGQSYGGYRPAVRSEKWLQRWHWMDTLGGHCWPILGAVYMISAVKRVPGMRLMEPGWKNTQKAKAAARPIIGRNKLYKDAFSAPSPNLIPKESEW